MRVLRAAVAACLLICTGCALPGYESPGFRGQILDRTTMQPIPSAQVSVAPFFERGLTSVTISDPAGRFGIPPTDQGRIALHPISLEEAWTDAWLEVSAEGYQPHEVAVLDLTKRESPEIVVYLDRR